MSNLKHAKIPGKQQAGFTLVELVTVITIMAIIAAYLTVRLGGAGDEAKLSITRTVLLKDIPQALLTYRAADGLSCRSLATGDPAPTAGDSTTANTVASILVQHGASELNPWGDHWFAGYNAADRVVTVAYPIMAVNPDTAVRNFTNSIVENSGILWVKGVVDGTQAHQFGATGGTFEGITTIDPPAGNSKHQIHVGYRCL